MHYIPVEKFPKEHVQFIEENQTIPATRSWLNFSATHKVDIVEVGFNYYVRVFFSKEEYYYIASFDCEKSAKNYVKSLFE